MAIPHRRSLKKNWKPRKSREMYSWMMQNLDKYSWHFEVGDGMPGEVTADAVFDAVTQDGHETKFVDGKNVVIGMGGFGRYVGKPK